MEIAYGVDDKHQGKGYATEAARTAIQIAFEDLHVMRVDLQVRSDNLPSQRVARREPGCGRSPCK